MHKDDDSATNGTVGETMVHKPLVQSEPDGQKSVGVEINRSKPDGPSATAGAVKAELISTSVVL